MAKPKNLLFDLGGVIMDIDRMNCVRAYRRLGFADVENFLGEYVQKGIFSDLESGAISPADFRAEIRRHIPGEVSDVAIDAAFSEFLTGIPLYRLEALRRLRAAYGIYLLSNTNPIMWDGRIASEFRQEGLEVADYFDGIMTSFEARCMKPATGIFMALTAKTGIVPAETLFFDDSAANLEAAAGLGFMTALVPPGTEFEEIIAAMEE